MEKGLLIYIIKFCIFILLDDDDNERAVETILSIRLSNKYISNNIQIRPLFHRALRQRFLFRFCKLRAIQYSNLIVNINVNNRIATQCCLKNIRILNDKASGKNNFVVITPCASFSSEKKQVLLRQLEQLFDKHFYVIDGYAGLSYAKGILTIKFTSRSA